jgi:hypothetical protein
MNANSHTIRSAAMPLAVPSTSGLETALVFLLGLLLPAVALSPWGSDPHSLLGRATLVDLTVLLALAGFARARGVLRVPAAAWVYFVALLVAFTIGLSRSVDNLDVQTCVVAMLSLVMAWTYFVAGASIATSPKLAKAFVVGLIGALLWQGIVVLHDYSLPASAWFPDNESRRVRGTFRSNGQLGAFGFSAAGILLCLGWPLFESGKRRMIVVAAAALPLFFVLAASRRSGLAALLIWLALYLVLGFRHALRKTYPILLAVVIAATVWIVRDADELSATYTGVRVQHAIDQVASGNSAFQLQFQSALDSIGMWFPFGVGPGHGYQVVKLDEYSALRTEVHDGHLALIVELGVFGWLAFYAMMARPVFRQWGPAMGPAAPMVRTLVITFVLAGAAFMIHNRLHRDRGFLLFLGLAAGITTAAATQSAPPGVMLAIRRRRPAANGPDA